MTPQTTTRGWLCAATLLAALLALAAPATGRAANDKLARAKALFVQAQQHYQQSAFGAALAKFQAALKLALKPSILLNIAQCHRRLGQERKAAFYYRFYLAEYKRAHPGRAPPFAREVKAHIGRLQRAMAQRKSSAEQRKKLEAERRALEAKRRQLEAKMKAEREARKAAERRRAADAKRYSAALRTAEQKRRAAEARQRAEQKRRAELAEAVARSRRSKTLWGWTALIGGLACASVAGVLYGVGISQGNSAHDRYLAAKPGEDQLMIDEWSKVESARTKVYVAHGLAAAAGVAVAIGLYALLTRPDLNERAASGSGSGNADAAPPSPRLDVAFGPLGGGGAALLVGGRF